MKHIKVKICGITTVEQAIEIAALPVNTLGFICYPKSPRYIPPAKIKEICQQMPPFVQTVGVFVNESAEHMIEVYQQTGLGMVQLHGLTAAAVPWIKAIVIKAEEDLQQISDYNLRYVLLDAYCPEEKGGTGKKFDWSLAQKASANSDCKIILAGGIGPENIAEAAKEVQPYGVDLSSSVEVSKGVKDIAKIKELLRIMGKLE